MKNRLLILAAALVCMTAACSKEAESFKGTDQKSSKPMTEYEMKDALQEAALNAINEISFTSETDLIEVARYYTEHYKYFDLDDAYSIKLRKIRKEEYETVHPDAVEIAADILNSMAAITKAPTASNVTYYYYRALIDASFASIAGIFRASDSKYMWLFTDSNDRIEFRFANYDGRSCVLSIVPKGKQTVKYNEVEKYISNTHYAPESGNTDYGSVSNATTDATIEIPTSLTVKLTADDKVLASLDLKAGVGDLAVKVNEDRDWTNDYENNKWGYNLDTTTVAVSFSKINVAGVLTAGDYSIEADASAKSGKLVESMGLYKGKQELLSECIRFPYDLGQLTQALYDFDHNPTFVAVGDVVGTIEGTVALGPDVFVKVNLDFSKYENIMDAKSSEEYVEAMNSMTQYYLYYGETKWQARMLMVYDKEKDSVSNMLEFADGTQYQIGDYLTPDNFYRTMLGGYGVYTELMTRWEEAYRKIYYNDSPFNPYV